MNIQGDLFFKEDNQMSVNGVTQKPKAKHEVKQTTKKSEGYTSVNFASSKIKASYQLKNGTELGISGLGTCVVKNNSVFVDGKKVDTVKLTEEQIIALGTFDVNKDGKIDQTDIKAVRKIEAPDPKGFHLSAKRKDQMSARINKKFQKNKLFDSNIYPKQPIYAGVMLSKDNEGFLVRITDKKGNTKDSISLDVNPKTDLDFYEYMEFPHD